MRSEVERLMGFCESSSVNFERAAEIHPTASAVCSLIGPVRTVAVGVAAVGFGRVTRGWFGLVLESLWFVSVWFRGSSRQGNDSGINLESAMVGRVFLLSNSSGLALFDNKSAIIFSERNFAAKCKIVLRSAF